MLRRVIMQIARAGDAGRAGAADQHRDAAHPASRRSTERPRRIVFMGGSAEQPATSRRSRSSTSGRTRRPRPASSNRRCRPRCTDWTCSPGSRSTARPPTGSAPSTNRRSAWRVSCCTGAAPGLTGSGHDYVGLIGDAGALVCLTNPELFTTATLRSGSTSAGSAAARPSSTSAPIAQDAADWTSDPWPRIDVVLDGDLAAAAGVVEFLRLYGLAPDQTCSDRDTSGA